jgi:hypothetical protein
MEYIKNHASIIMSNVISNISSEFRYNDYILYIQEIEQNILLITYESLITHDIYETTLDLENFFVKSYTSFCDHLAKTHPPIFTRLTNILSNTHNVFVTFQTNVAKIYYSINLHKKI